MKRPLKCQRVKDTWYRITQLYAIVLSDIRFIQSRQNDIRTRLRLVGYHLSRLYKSCYPILFIANKSSYPTHWRQTSHLINNLTSETVAMASKVSDITDIRPWYPTLFIWRHILKRCYFIHVALLFSHDGVVYSAAFVNFSDFVCNVSWKTRKRNKPTIPTFTGTTLGLNL